MSGLRGVLAATAVWMSEPNELLDAAAELLDTFDEAAPLDGALHRLRVVTSAMIAREMVENLRGVQA